MAKEIGTVDMTQICKNGLVLSWSGGTAWLSSVATLFVIET